MAGGVTPPPDLPARTVEFGMVGGMVAVSGGAWRRAGAMWEPGTRRWLIGRKNQKSDTPHPTGRKFTSLIFPTAPSAPRQGALSELTT